LRGIGLLVTVTGLLSCASPEAQKVLPSLQPSSPAASEAAGLDATQGFTQGATLYVPIYSHIYFEDQKSVLNLTATLSVRNTDFKQKLILTSVRYYDSEGNLVRQYLDKPLQLNAMASKSFVIPRADTSGGSGANFIVEWAAQSAITEPVKDCTIDGRRISSTICVNIGIGFLVIRNINPWELQLALGMWSRKSSR
jgi:hypothetical protein